MTVRFASLNDIREFVGLATLQPYPIQIHDGDRTVNAKSFMEMFTLDFAHPLLVEIGGGNEGRFVQAAQKFLADA